MQYRTKMIHVPTGRITYLEAIYDNINRAYYDIMKNPFFEIKNKEGYHFFVEEVGKFAGPYCSRCGSADHLGINCK